MTHPKPSVLFRLGIVPIAFVFLVVAIVQELEAAKVSDSPKLVALVDELSNPEDTNATITCSIGSGDTNTLVYEWFKNDERIYSTGGKVRIDIPAENYQSVLRVFNLKPKDSGLYTCVAKNRFGQDKISTKLSVKVQLKWIEQPKDMEVPVGKNLYIPCKAEGVPSPEIEWRKVQSEEATEVQTLGSELRFNAIGQLDSGLYECRARNGVDEELRSRIKIDVLGE